MAKKIALLIGNDHYTDPKLDSLAVPASDVDALQAVLTDKNVCDFDDIKVLLNETMEKIMAAIGELFNNKHRDDLLLLYFSGHGLVDAAGDLYFALKNTQFAQLLGTALPSSFVKEALNKSKSRRQLLILDCCHSGAFQRGAKGVGNVAINEHTFEVNGYGREILASSAATQLSWEGDQVLGDTNKSLFTHYVVEGLATGKAAPQGGEQITAEQLYQYAHDKVVQIKPEMKPQRWVDRQQGSLIIAHNPNPLPKAAALPKEVKEALHSENYLARSAAVDELAKNWLSSHDAARLLAAEQALTELKERERDKDVYQKVQQVLDAHSNSKQQTPDTAPSTPGQDPANDPVSKPEVKKKSDNNDSIFHKAIVYGVVSLLIVFGAFVAVKLNEQYSAEQNTSDTAKNNLNEQLKDKQKQEQTRQLEKINALIAQAEQAAQTITADSVSNRQIAKAVKNYNAVLSLAPNNPRATKGLEGLMQQFLAWAQTAIDNNDIAKAKHYLDSADFILPQHSDITTMRESLQHAETISALLAQAERALRSNNLTTDKHNAVESYRQVLAMDPDNPSATQGLERVLPRHPDIHNKREKLTQLEQSISPPAGAVFRDELKDGGTGPAMVVIPAGPFTMGSPDKETGRDSDEGPQHPVTIAEFAMGQTEVTRSEFEQFVKATRYRTEAEKSGGCYSWKDGEWKTEADISWRNPGFEQSHDHPVVCVTWNDAKAYISWLNQQTGGAYRLPSEAEWEYAARAKTDTARVWGDKPKDACRYANVADQTAATIFTSWTIHDCSDDHIYTAPTGQFKPNNFYLHDMLGNVWEWTQDCWNDRYNGAPEDGSAWESGGCERRVLRGGSWGSRPRGVRSASRVRDGAGGRYGDVGFRLARDL